MPVISNNNQGTNAANKGDRKYMMLVIFLAVSVILNIILFIVLGVRKYQSTQHFCPHDWIGLKNYCYYFSKQKGSWDSSRRNCSTQEADLTVIDTKEEMDSLERYKCMSDHWIGLEMRENQKGKWVNGVIFNNLFYVKGNEKCTYLSDDGIATARCYTERKWICRKKMDTS